MWMVPRQIRAQREFRYLLPSERERALGIFRCGFALLGRGHTARCLAVQDTLTDPFSWTLPRCNNVLSTVLHIQVPLFGLFCWVRCWDWPVVSRVQGERLDPLHPLGSVKTFYFCLGTTPSESWLWFCAQSNSFVLRRPYIVSGIQTRLSGVQGK